MPIFTIKVPAHTDTRLESSGLLRTSRGNKNSNNETVDTCKKKMSQYMCVEEKREAIRARSGQLPGNWGLFNFVHVPITPAIMQGIIDYKDKFSDRKRRVRGTLGAR